MAVRMKRSGQEEARLQKIDSEELRAIHEAQEERQQRMLKVVLEAANQQQHALLERAGQIFTAIGPTASPASAVEFVTNSLSTRLPEFIYDPDNGCSSKYGSTDGLTLNVAARARLIVSKLDAAAYARFTNHILPQGGSEVGFDDTVKTLKELFEHNTSNTAQRRISQRLYWDGRRRHEMAKFNAIIPQQMKCLMWICGPHTTDDAEIRTRDLRKMEDNPQTTLKKLSLEIQQFLNVKQDAKLLGSPPSLLQPEVNAVATTKNRTRDPPSSCFLCGGSHWAKDCYFINKTCHKCKLVGHKKVYCKNFANKKERNLKTRRTTNNVVVIASSGTDINSATIQMRLHTVADVTLLSVKDWIKINRPKLLPPFAKLKSADNKDIKVHGYFECDFDIDGHKGRGNCHDADTQSLLGLDWITQNKPSFRHVTEDIICKVSATATAKVPIKAQLNLWPKPTAPWNRVHADFAGPIDGTYYLAIMDAYSNWPEIVHMNCISTSATISALKIFAQFGDPQTLVTDNGTQFTSTLFKEFCRAHGIGRLRSSPSHPQSNG
ncbi:unnamed protein product [Toxocara canis]|uniref:Integrase catalytic domain-containing protein n=1 Tax=Toxocara canis TaxID=6265 RepID=A0A183TZP5_TOXCA|nr:unnamed protein product [Toxocara canis]